MAEAQPNLPIYSSSDDDMDHLQLQPARNRCAADDRNGEFQLWEKPCVERKQRAGWQARVFRRYNSVPKEEAGQEAYGPYAHH